MKSRSSLALAALLCAAACGAPSAPSGADAGPPAQAVSAAALEALGQAPPDRPPYEGCAWSQFEGAGLALWTQSCPGQRLVADPASGRVLAEAVVDGVTTTSEAIRVLELTPAGLAALGAQLMVEGGAPAEATCTLAPAPAVVPIPEGRVRYSLEPTGLTLSAWEAAVSSNEVPETPPCGRYGVAAVGDRYVEIQASHPDKALFVELGSEAQIYEPNSIVFVGER